MKNVRAAVVATNASVADDYQLSGTLLVEAATLRIEQTHESPFNPHLPLPFLGARLSSTYGILERHKHNREDKDVIEPALNRLLECVALHDRRTHRAGIFGQMLDQRQEGERSATPVFIDVLISFGPTCIHANP